MEIRLYNTLTHRLEPFQPVAPGTVRMYHCGPTVYDFAHIGNFRAFLFADLLRRFFEFVGYRVEQVMNITDVGHMSEDQYADGAGQDKMELAAERLKEAKHRGEAAVENPEDPAQVAEYFAEAFLNDARALRMKVADEPNRLPRATANIEQMIELIRRLVEAGHAYVTEDGAVYYDVTSFPGYGRLSGNTLEKLQAGAGGRVSEAELAGKRNPNDFLLWKHDPKHLMRWESPWGVGYPGWHIECSAMALNALGVETLDLHTGGEDNIFPHHECEIAQSTGATGQPFANYWLHVRHLLVEGEKMSKSKGNFHTVRELLEKGVDPAALRYELLKTHYRANANFTEKGLEDSRKRVDRLRDLAAQAPEAPAMESPAMGDTDVERAFAEALADDLNVSAAVAELDKWVRGLGRPTAEDVATLRRLDQVLGGLAPSSESGAPEGTAAGAAAGEDSDAEIDAKCRRIDKARAQKDYDTADAIRDELREAGIEVQTTKEGTRWRRKARLSD